MARHKQSVFEDLIDITAMVPWWVGVALAVVSYLLLRSVATAELPNPADILTIGSTAGQQIAKSLATVGQYLLPFMFLMGAGLSALKRRKREKLHADVAIALQPPQALQNISWGEFEALVGEVFRRRGFSVIETGGGADGGVDLVLSRGEDRYLVQCKQWRAYKVGVTTVRELYGVMAGNGAAGGFVVTSGVFTDEAKAFASGRNIELIDGPKLTAMIAENSQNRAGAPAQVNVKQSVTGGVITCPVCGGPMLRRTAKKGSNAGGVFWGCASFPKCRGVRPI